MCRNCQFRHIALFFTRIGKVLSIIGLWSLGSAVNGSCGRSRALQGTTYMSHYVPLRSIILIRGSV